MPNAPPGNSVTHPFDLTGVTFDTSMKVFVWCIEYAHGETDFGLIAAPSKADAEQTIASLTLAGTHSIVVAEMLALYMLLTRQFDGVAALTSSLKGN